MRCGPGRKPSDTNKGRNVPAAHSRLTASNRFTLTLLVAVVLFGSAAYLSLTTFSDYRATKLHAHELTSSLSAFRYYDEVLTMSTRMAAFTGWSKWKERYDHHAPLLENELARMLRLYPQLEKAIDKTSLANERLVKLEAKALALAQSGNLYEAQQLLFSDAYENEKEVYSRALVLLGEQTDAHIAEMEDDLHQKILLSATLVTTLFAFIALALIHAYRVQSFRRDLESALGDIAGRLVTHPHETAADVRSDLRWAMDLIVRRLGADHSLLLRRKTTAGNTGSIGYDLQLWIAGKDADDHLHIDSGQLTAEKLWPALARPDAEGNLHFAGIRHMPATWRQRFSPLSGLGIDSIVGTFLSRRKVGEYVLCFASRKQAPAWKQPDPGLLRSLAEMLISAIESQEKSEQLTRLATTDSLTGLASRRRFTEQLEHEILAGKRSGLSSGLLMIDIDHFKRTNDTYGHAAGDAVLVDFAAATRSMLREVDTIGRLGGEEFGVILPNSDAANAETVAQRIRRTIEARPIVAGSDELRITISIGVTLITGLDPKPDAPLIRADHALYTAKDGGRNQVRVQLKGTGDSPPMSS